MKAGVESTENCMNGPEKVWPKISKKSISKVFVFSEIVELAREERFDEVLIIDKEFGNFQDELLSSYDLRKLTQLI